MKEMNRREFLTLTGAAVVALSLAGCVGAPSAPTPSNDIRVQAAAGPTHLPHLPQRPPARKPSCWQLSTMSGRKSTL